MTKTAPIAKVKFSKSLTRDLEAGINNIHAKYEWSGRGDYRSDLSACVSRQLGIRKEYANDLIQAIFEIITRELEAGGRVVLPGIGAIFTSPKRYTGQTRFGTVIKGRAVRFVFHQSFVCKFTGFESMNDKYNAIAKARRYAWREKHRPDLHKKAILRLRNKEAAVSPVIVPIRDKVKALREENRRVRRSSCGVLDELEKNK